MKLLTVCLLLVHTASSQIKSFNFGEAFQSPQSERPREVACAVNFLPSTHSVDNEDRLTNAIDVPPPRPTQTSDTPDTAQNCECVPYYLCNKNRTTSQNGQSMLDIRFSILSGVGLVSTPPYKTCPCSKAVSDPKPIKSDVCNNYLDICCSPAEPSFDQPSSLSYKPPECGRRKTTIGNIDFKILSSAGRQGEADYGEFPWMVAILGEGIVNGRKESFVYLCGGSLIHPSVVLSAAHCVKGVSGLSIRAGVWDTQAHNEPNPSQEGRVHHVDIHEDYYAGTLFNDIALLFLESPIQLAPNVGLVCLPQPGEIFDRRECFASGWGKDGFEKERKYQVVLKKVELPVVPTEICNEKFRLTRLGRYFRLHESFICAGGKTGQDTCQGDGGSPLVCPSRHDPDVFVQAGIVSWGIGCGGETPGAYVNVAHFRGWIDSHIAALAVDDRFGNPGKR